MTDTAYELAKKINRSPAEEQMRLDLVRGEMAQEAQKGLNQQLMLIKLNSNKNLVPIMNDEEMTIKYLGDITFEHAIQLTAIRTRMRDERVAEFKASIRREKK